MEYIVPSCIVLCLLVVKGILDSKKEKKLRYEKFFKEFGTISEETYSEEKLKSLKSYYESVKSSKYDIDDITWNDLELEELYFILNQTVSAVGEEYLYAMLRQPRFETDELKERERLIRFFLEHPRARADIQNALFQIGKNRRHSVYACMDFMKTMKSESCLFHYISCFALIGCILAAFTVPTVGVFLTFAVATVNMVTYLKYRAKLELCLSTVTNIVRMLYAAQDLGKLGIPEIQAYTEKMQQLNRNFSGFKRNFWIIGSRKPTGDLWDMLASYLRMLFHMDLIKFNSMLKIYEKHAEDLKQLYEAAGYLDALCSVASFRAFLGTDGYCIPVFSENSKPVFEAELLYHPLLDSPVKNTVKTDKSVLLTGSNASGKSTFLKSVAIGALLAQTIHTVPAKSYKGSLFQILSSMALRDNMQESESYFIVEIKSLKRIFEAAKAPVCTLCFVDEVLRGTNTVERIAASREVLSGLTGNGRTICFAATHDIELTYLLEKECDNYHFEEQVTDELVEFDYILRKGRATSRNAIKLLSMIGYPRAIIEKAEQSATHFLQTGEWT